MSISNLPTSDGLGPISKLSLGLLQPQHFAFDTHGDAALAAPNAAFEQRNRATPHQHRRTIHLGDDDRADLLQIMDEADPADHEALIAARGMNSAYHFNGIKYWKVQVDGMVTNVEA